MNLLIVKTEELTTANTAVISGARAKYIYEFHNLKPGIEVACGILNGAIGKALIKKVSHDEIQLDLTVNKAPAVHNDWRVLLALPRPQILKKVLSVVCELGISELNLVVSERTVKSYASAEVLRPEKLEYFLIKGLEQAANTLMPKLNFFQRLDPALQAAENSPAVLKLIAHSENSLILKDVFQDQSPCVQACTENSIFAAIGPESGWSDAELDKFRTNNFAQINLGTRILRVDTAISYLFGQVSAFS